MTVNTPASTALRLRRPDAPLSGPFSRRRLLAGLVATPVLAALVAACGDDTVDPGSDDTGTTGSTVPGDTGTTVPGADGTIAHATGADDVVLRIAYEGGFVMPQTLFVNQPALLVSGDGRAFVPGAVPAIYPGPLVMPMGVRTISEAGIQTLLRLAQDAGLLAPAPDYSAEMNIADAPDTVVRITTSDGTWEHRAYALGMQGDETTPARQTLARFVTAALDLGGTVGAGELGEESLAVPTQYRVRATPVVEADLSGMDPAPTFVDWPASTGLDLATAADCARLAADAAGTVLTDATQLTYFRQDGVTYGLAAAGVLPGDSPC